MKERGINDIIRIISISSFIFAVLNSIFSIFGMEGTNNYLFLWITTNLFFFYLMKKKKDHWRYISPLVMLLPVVFLREVHDFLFLAIVVLLAQFFLQGRIENYRYATITEEFRKNFLVLAVIYGFSILVGGMGLFSKYVAPYIFIYLITSIVLLRTLRYMENMGNAEKINKINLRATLGIIILSMGTSNEWVLKILKSILVTLKAGYDRVINFIFAWLVIPLAYLMDRYFRFDLGFLKEGKDDPQQIVLDGELEFMDESIMSPEAAEQINQFILNVLLVVFIVGFIYLIFRIYAKQAKKEIIAEEYVESKEFIFKERKKEVGFFKRLTNFIKPKSNEEKIRLYYKKFLENCQEHQIEIRGSDTSLDVSKKAQYIFDPIIMEKMRKIYIRVRYGQQKVNTSTYEEFKGYYKELNRIAKNKSS